MEKTAVFKRFSSGTYAANGEVLEDILVKFSQLVTDFPEIEEMDINPLIIDAQGVVAVDARIVIDTNRMMREVAEHHEHLVIAP